MEEFKKLLLIAGTGRNTGKTLLASSIIERFSPDLKITGLKISPHFHNGTESLQSLYKNENFNIYQETSLTSLKDSSRMLKAGAHKVFYIECYDEYMQEAYNKFLELADVSGPIICESLALRKYVRPGIFFIVDSKYILNKKQDVLDIKQKADLFIETDNENSASIINRISYNHNSWMLEKN